MRRTCQPLETAACDVDTTQTRGPRRSRRCTVTGGVPQPTWHSLDTRQGKKRVSSEHNKATNTPTQATTGCAAATGHRAVQQHNQEQTRFTHVPLTWPPCAPLQMRTSRNSPASLSSTMQHRGTGSVASQLRQAHMDAPRFLLFDDTAVAFTHCAPSVPVSVPEPVPVPVPECGGMDLLGTDAAARVWGAPRPAATPEAGPPNRVSVRRSSVDRARRMLLLA